MFINPIPDVAGYIRHETYILWRHFVQCFLDIGFDSAERVGQGEVGGCTRRVQTAWLSPNLALETPWLALGGPLLSSYAQSGWESPLTLYGTLLWWGSLFPSLDERLSAKSHDYHKLVSGWVWFETQTLEDGCKSLVWSFRAEDLTELGIWLVSQDFPPHDDDER